MEGGFGWWEPVREQTAGLIPSGVEVACVELRP